MLIGDASDRTILDELLGDTVFDIIIDDGGHTARMITNTFNEMYNSVQPDGIYWVEDLYISLNVFVIIRAV